jgi:hypothetical protein
MHPYFSLHFPDFLCPRVMRNTVGTCRLANKIFDSFNVHELAHYIAHMDMCCVAVTNTMRVRVFADGSSIRRGTQGNGPEQ